MRIVLIGSGRMGTAVARLAGERDHELSAIFSSTRTVSDDGAAISLGEADVAIDFSVPGAVRDNVSAAIRAGVPIVVGTTGWYDEVDSMRSIVEAGRGALLYSPNFSLGIALLFQAVRAVTPLLNRLEEFDTYVNETHHVRKADSPSGTALHLGRVLLEGLDRKTALRTEAPHGESDPSSLQVTSTRAGSVFGEHNVQIDGPDDHLTFAHVAKSRDGFARGAVVAAEWLIGRSGVYTLDDLLREWMMAEEEAGA